MGMKQFQQITDALSTPKGEITFDNWEKIIFSSVDSKTYKSVNIRRLKLDIDMNLNPDSLLASLNRYFEKINCDIMISQNKVCKKGCCDCCTNDFEISASEYFMLLRYMDIKFGKDFIQTVSRKARISFNSPNCIFVNNTDGACTIYEARPLICRKYGLYGNLTDCKKINSENLLCTECNTAENTLYFRFSNKPNARILSKPNRIVYWFANTENGLPSADKMKALYKASYAQNIDTYIELLLC